MIAAVRGGYLYHPDYGTPNGSNCKMGMSFVLNTVGYIDAAVPAAGYDTQIWTTPNEPFMLEHAMLLLTDTATASQNPGTPNLTLKVAGSGLVTGNMSTWTGTSYPITGGAVIMWMARAGLGLFDNYFANGNGNSNTGATGADYVFAALTAGNGADGFWNKPVTLHVEHGAGSITMKISFRAIIVGRFL